MKGLSIFVAIVGGMAIGAAIGLLFAPEKGDDLRNKIAETVKAHGVKLNHKEMENLVDDITDELKTSGDE